MSRKNLIAAAAFASLAVAFVPAAASAKMGGGRIGHVPRTDATTSFNGSGTKIYVKPLINKDLGLRVGCRRERAINELGVRFMRRTNCVLY